MSDRKVIAILGGTGNEGGGLAIRWALSGHQVIIGSRSAEKAQAAAEEYNAASGCKTIIGLTNPEAAEKAEIVVMTVPYQAHRITIESVQNHCRGKIFVDVTVPLAPPVYVVTLPEGRTAAEEAQALLGPDVQVVSAFQNIAAGHLTDINHPFECDVLVTGDSEGAKTVVLDLAADAGLRGIDAGPLANAIIAESLTPLMIWVNKKYKAKGAGIRITGLDD